MKVIVDTCVWSLALRRIKGGASAATGELQSLILDNRVQMLGPIRQEILSGIKTSSQFERVRRHLASFPDFPLLSGDYETAASFFNICRRRGVQGSNTDFLVCAAAVRGEFVIFTLDSDFRNFSRHIPISLHEFSPQ